MAVATILRSSRFRRLSKEGFWVIAGQVTSILGMLVGVRVMTELLDPVSYGEVALSMTIALLVSQAILGPLGQGVMRFYSQAAEKEDLRGYARAARSLIVLASAFIAVLMACLFVGFWLAEKSTWAWMTLVAFMLALLLGYNSLLNGVQNAARQRAIVALHQGMLTWARFLLAAGAIAALGANSISALVGYVVAGVAVLVSQSFFFKNVVPRTEGETHSEQYWRNQLVGYSWPFAVWGIFSWLQISSDRWALELLSTTDDVGLYAVLFQLGTYPMTIASGLAVQFLAPIMFQRAGDASDSQRNSSVKRLTWRLTVVTLSLTGIAVLLGLLLHERIFSILVASEYHAVSALLPWVLLSGGLFAAGQTVSLQIMSLMKPKRLLPVKICTALLGVVLNFLGAYTYGVPGVVGAGVLFSLAFFVWTWSLAVRSPSGT